MTHAVRAMTFSYVTQRSWAMNHSFVSRKRWGICDMTHCYYFTPLSWLIRAMTFSYATLRSCLMNLFLVSRKRWGICSMTPFCVTCHTTQVTRCMSHDAVLLRPSVAAGDNAPRHSRARFSECHARAQSRHRRYGSGLLAPRGPLRPHWAEYRTARQVLWRFICQFSGGLYGIHRALFGTYRAVLQTIWNT